jgi:hypothetical protein
MDNERGDEEKWESGQKANPPEAVDDHNAKQRVKSAHKKIFQLLGQHIST